MTTTTKHVLLLYDALCVLFVRHSLLLKCMRRRRHDGGVVDFEFAISKSLGFVRVCIYQVFDIRYALAVGCQLRRQIVMTLLMCTDNLLGHQSGTTLEVRTMRRQQGQWLGS